MKFQLKDSKIMPQSFLTNGFLDQSEVYKIPRYCFFIGAGCSISSNITSSSGIIEICQKLSFFNIHKLGSQIKRLSGQSFIELMGKVDELVNDNKMDFDNYVFKKEMGFELNVRAQNICKRLPQNIVSNYLTTFGESEFERKLYEDFGKRIVHESLYGDWFQEYSEDRRERQKLIEKIIAKQIVSEEYVIFSNLIRLGYIKNVFTTNFDDLINETLLSYNNCKAITYSHNEVANYITIGSNRPNIIKLHGDYLFENIKNVTSETGSLESNMLRKFEEFLSTLDLVVIGYSGADHSIMSALENIKSKTSFKLLWCGLDENNLHWRVANLINNSDNSFFIKIDSFLDLLKDITTEYQIFDFPTNLISIAEGKELTLKNILESLGISTVGKYMNDEKEKENLKQLRTSAISSILSRNMSHNIGSHVLSKLKDDDYKNGNQLKIFNKYWQNKMDWISIIGTNTDSFLRRQTFQEIFASFLKTSERYNQILLEYISGYDNIGERNVSIILSDQENIRLLIPYGELGIQAINSILENIINNAFKHNGFCSKDSEFLFKISYSIPYENSNLVEICISDNSRQFSFGTTINFADKINEKLADPIFDLKTRSIMANKGLAVMKIAAAYLRQIENTEIDQYHNPNLLFATMDSDIGLAYHFYLMLEKEN